MPTWNYSKINQAIADQGTPLATNRRAVRTMKNLLASVPGWAVRYACDGTTAGTAGDGVDRWTTDADLHYGNGVGLTSSWFVAKFSGVSNAEVLINLVANAQFANLYLGSYGSGAIPVALVALAVGAGGNAINVIVRGDNAPSAGVTFTEVSNLLTIHYESGVSTPDDIVTALSTSTLVQASGSGTNPLNTLTDDLTYQWTQLTPATTPTAEGGGMAIDVNNDLIMFGTGSVSSTTETWKWNGTDWAQLTPATTPGSVNGAPTVYDSNRSKIVMVRSIFPATGETWEWDGTDWTQATPIVPAPAVRNTQLAFDPVRNVVVLFGGSDPNGNATNQTWEYDGTTWVHVIPATTTPSVRTGCSLSWDPITASVIMFGGFQPNTFTALNDTWSWDGTDWTALSPAASPPTLNNIRSWLVRYAGRNRLILQTQRDSSNNYQHQTWTWDGATWAIVLDRVSGQPSPPSDVFLFAAEAGGRLIYFSGTANGSGATYETWFLEEAPLLLSGGVDDTGIDVELRCSRAAGFTGGSTTITPSAADMTAAYVLPLSPTPGDQYIEHLIYEVAGGEWRVALHSADAALMFFNLGKVLDPVSGWTTTTIFGAVPSVFGGAYEIDIGGAGDATGWPGLLTVVADVDGRAPIVRQALWSESASSYLGHVADVAQGGPGVLGDYLTDLGGTRWTMIAQYQLVTWPIGTADLVTSYGGTPAPASDLGRIVPPETGSSAPTVRRTARSGRVQQVKQGVATNVQVFMQSATDSAGLPGCVSSMVIKASKNGAAGATITPTITDLSGSLGAGWYNLALTTTHTNTVGTMPFHITADGAQDNDDLVVEVYDYVTTNTSPSAIANAVLDALLTDHAVVGSVADGIAVAAGLLQGNFYLDNTNNSSPNGQTEARVRVFRSGADASAATSGGVDEGEFATFVVTTTYSGPNKVTTHRVVRQ